MTESVITTIRDNIADAKGVEPSNLDLTLYDHIDVDSVARLVDDEKGSWSLAFDIPEYTVTVWDDGSVLVEPKKQPKTI